MAEDDNRQQFLKGMRYSEMSNLVMSSDKRDRGPRIEGLTGEPESLAGKINAREMGSRLPVSESVTEKTTLSSGQYVAEDQITRKRKRDRAGDFLNVLDATEYEGLTYRPKGPEGRQNFANILTLTTEVIGDVAHDILRSAADAALEIMKDDSIHKDFDKKKQIEDLWGTTMSQNQFTQLVQFSKRIVDYEDDAVNENRRREDELAEQYGVTMQVDEEDEEDKIDFDDSDEEDEVEVNIADDAQKFAYPI